MEICVLLHTINTIHVRQIKTDEFTFYVSANHYKTSEAPSVLNSGGYFLEI
jgi:hypothetical protein